MTKINVMTVKKVFKITLAMSINELPLTVFYGLFFSLNSETFNFISTSVVNLFYFYSYILSQITGYNGARNAKLLPYIQGKLRKGMVKGDSINSVFNP